MKMKNYTQVVVYDEIKDLDAGSYFGDEEEYMEKMNSMGYQTTDIISPNPKTKFFYVNDPDGLKIQLIQMG